MGIFISDGISIPFDQKEMLKCDQKQLKFLLLVYLTQNWHDSMIHMG